MKKYRIKTLKEFEKSPRIKWREIPGASFIRSMDRYFGYILSEKENYAVSIDKKFRKNGFLFKEDTFIEIEEVDIEILKNGLMI